MIHVVTPENRHLYERQLLEQHRLRHDVYIKERKWSGLHDRGGLEYDAYDTEDATYLLAIEDGDVVGGTRLSPTTKPHMLEEVCPQLATVRGIPRGHDIRDWTRIYVRHDRRDGRYGGAVVGQLFTATFEYCLEQGIRALNVTFEAWWFPRLQLLGWKMTPLGLPGLIEDEWWVAVTMPIDQDTIRATRAHNKVEGEVLVQQGIARYTQEKVA